MAKTDPPPTRDVNRDGGTDSAICLRSKAAARQDGRSGDLDG